MVYKDIPFLTKAQMVEVDRAMVNDYGILLIQMMENAGRNLAHLARERFLDGDPRGKRVVVLAGTGGNGGGALVCARRLHNYGAMVQVVVTKPKSRFTPVPAHQLEIVSRMGIPILSEENLDSISGVEFIIDGLIGYSLSGAPRGPAANIIHWANLQGGSILSLDVPSGLDASTGLMLEPCIKATATLTLALPKEGLRAECAIDAVGELYLADISVPNSLYRMPALNLEIGSIFARKDIVRLR